MAKPGPLTPEDERLLQAALALIEEAQNTMETACQRLCPVAGGGKVWSAVGREVDRVKASWHRVNNFYRHRRNAR